MSQIPFWNLRRFLLNFSHARFHGSTVQRDHGSDDFQSVRNRAACGRRLNPFRHQHDSVIGNEKSSVTHDSVAWFQHYLGTKFDVCTLFCQEPEIPLTRKQQSIIVDVVVILGALQRSGGWRLLPRSWPLASETLSKSRQKSTPSSSAPPNVSKNRS